MNAMNSSMDKPPLSPTPNFTPAASRLNEKAESHAADSHSASTVAEHSDVQSAKEFDDLLAVTAHVCNVPLVVLTADTETHYGYEGVGAEPDLWRERQFCSEAARGNDALVVVENMLASEQWRDHPFVRGEPRIRFYAGTTLRTDDGRLLGQLSAVGYLEQTFHPRQRAAFARLARQVVRQIELQHNLPGRETSLNEQRLRVLVDHAPAGLVLVNRAGIASSVSAAVTEVTGYAASEIIGRDLFSFVHPEDIKDTLESFAGIVGTSRAKCSFEFRWRCQDGSWKWFEAAAQNFLDDTALRAVACNMWEIGLRKAAEAKLRENEARFRRIMDSNMVGIFFWHADGRILDANDRFLEMTGYTREDLMAGRVNHLGLTPPEFAELDRGAFGQLATLGVCTPFEKEYTRKDGSRLPILLGAATLEGQSDQGVCFIIDVLDRKRMEQDLIRERNLLRTLIDHIPDYIYVKDTESRYLANNKASIKLMGLINPDEAMGKTAFDFFSPELAVAYHRDDQALFRSGKPVLDLEEDIVGVDGLKRLLQTTKVPLHDVHGKINGLVGISRDITDKVALEGQLRQSQKMECVGQLAGGVAHDFNNILTIVQGHAANLLSQQLTPSVHHAAQEIARAAERAASLTRQLLAFSRRNVIQPRNIDLNETVGHLANMLQRVLGEHITLQVEPAAKIPAVFADPGTLEQVLMNLAVNARDAMPKGGRLVISLKTAEFDSFSASHHPDARPGNFVVLVVSDSGCGISKQNLDHIFEPFYTTKDVGAGTGLGLATVYGIVKQHGGWISVRSEVGRGTTFEINLPISNKPAANSSAIAQNVRGGFERILLVEDEDSLRDLVRCILESYGYTVIDAASGHIAFERWKERTGEFDLLLTDIVMPDGITGRDLAEVLKAEKPGLRVLFTSGYSSDIIGKDFILSEGINFLQKPYNPQLLAQTVRDCLDR